MGKSISLKQVILDISSMRYFTIQLLDKGKPYKFLLKYLLEKYNYYDEDSSLGTIKEILRN